MRIEGGKQNRIDERSDLHWLSPVLSGSDIFALKYEPHQALSSDIRKYLIASRHKIVLAIRALFEAHSCIEDAAIALKMARRYPWKNRVVSKHKHLDMTYFLYSNYCYAYKEKVKLLGNSTNAAAEFLGCCVRVDVKKETAKVDSGLRKTIRRRGQTVHEWKEIHEPLSTFGMISLLADIGPSEYIAHKKLLYGGVKFEIASEIESGLTFMAAHFSELCECSKSGILGIIERWDELNLVGP